MSGTVSFTFAVSLSNMAYFNSQSGNCSGNGNLGNCPNANPFYSSNVTLTTNGCNSGWFANLWDSQTSGNASANCGKGCTGGCSSSCNYTGNPHFCGGFGNCQPTNCSPAWCVATDHNVYINYNCYQPNSSIVPMGNGMPTPSFQFNGYDTNSSQPSFVYYTVTYNVSDITTPAQVQALINAFGSSSPNTPSSYAASNDQSLGVLLQSVCSANAANLTTAPCSSYCGVGQTSATGTVNGTSISQNPANCPTAYTAYCNQNSTFTNSTCATWYTASQINSALPSSSDAYQVLTTQCNNPAYFSAPSNPNAAFPNDTYTINPSAPPICGCFYPPVVSNTFYTALNNEYPGIVAGSSSVACNFPPCAQNEVSLSVLNANPTCPSTNLTSCVNDLYVNNSTLTGVSQSNACNQNVTNTATNTTNNIVTTGSGPPATTVLTTTTTPTVLTTATTSKTTAPNAIGIALTVLFFVFGVGSFGWFLYQRRPRASEASE